MSLSDELVPFYNKIRWYALRVTGSADQADDIAQEVFLRYLSSGKQYEGNQLRNYLYKTARNYMIDLFRQKHPVCIEDEQILEYSDVTSGSPEQNVQNAELLALVFGRIKQLSPQQQEILHLRYEEQMKHNDIAEVMGLSSGNVRRILSETMVKLVKEFAEKI